MWSSRSSARPARGLKVLGAATALALGCGGCTPSYVKGSEASVLLIIADVNGGVVLKSDVRRDPSVVESDSVEVEVANRPKNPNFNNVPQVTMAILIERYEVRYFRSDGRGVEGADVPFRISGNLTVPVDVALSGTVAVPIEVVRAQAKLEPPLINLWGETPGELGGQALILTAFAEITLHGHTIAGQAVSATGRLQIDFADYPDGATP